MPASSRRVPVILTLTLQRPEAPHALAIPIAIAHRGLARGTPPVSQGK